MHVNPQTLIVVFEVFSFHKVNKVLLDAVSDFRVTLISF